MFQSRSGRDVGRAGLEIALRKGRGISEGTARCDRNPSLGQDRVIFVPTVMSDIGRE